MNGTSMLRQTPPQGKGRSQYLLFPVAYQGSRHHKQGCWRQVDPPLPQLRSCILRSSITASTRVLQGSWQVLACSTRHLPGLKVSIEATTTDVESYQYGCVKDISWFYPS